MDSAMYHACCPTSLEEEWSTVQQGLQQSVYGDQQSLLYQATMCSHAEPHEFGQGYMMNHGYPFQAFGHEDTNATQHDQTNLWNQYHFLPNFDCCDATPCPDPTCPDRYEACGDDCGIEELVECHDPNCAVIDMGCDQGGNTRCAGSLSDVDADAAGQLWEMQALHNNEAAVDPMTTHVCRWTLDDVECGHAFANDTDLHEHIVKVHTAVMSKGTGGFVCFWADCKREAGKQFLQRGKLERHMQTHSGYKDVACHLCGERLSTKQTLALHLLKHEGTKPYKCPWPECGYACTGPSQLKMHERTTHTHEKPLVCSFPGCGMTFAESSNKSKHEYTHRHPGNFKCTWSGCASSFPREDQLRRHMKQIHQGKRNRPAHRRHQKRLMGQGSPETLTLEGQVTDESGSRESSIISSNSDEQYKWLSESPQHELGPGQTSQTLGINHLDAIPLIQFRNQTSGY